MIGQTVVKLQLLDKIHRMNSQKLVKFELVIVITTSQNPGGNDFYTSHLLYYDLHTCNLVTVDWALRSSKSQVAFSKHCA